MTEGRRMRRRRKKPAGGQGCLCNQSLFGLVWARQAPLICWLQSSAVISFIYPSLAWAVDPPLLACSLHCPTQALVHPLPPLWLKGGCWDRWAARVNWIYSSSLKTHFPFIPLSTREHCKEPQCSASLQATQSHVCRQEPSTPCSAFVIRKALVNPPGLSLLRPGRPMLSLGPCLQLLLIPKGIWLLSLLAWTHCYPRESCNFMEPPPPNDGH